MPFSTCNHDDSIGPIVDGCRSGFDFTVLFELLAFTIIPSTLFLVASICRLPFLVRRRSIVHTMLQQATKLCAIAIWLIMQLVLLILVGTSSFKVSSLFVASSTVQLITGMFMIVLSYYEHSRSPRPSLLLNIYLAITLLFDIAEARTFWLASATKAETTYTSVFTAAIAVKATVLVLEMAHKRVRWSSEEPHSPEETSGIFGLGVYSWLTSLFMDGYRSILQVENLYPLDDALKGNTLNNRFQRHLDYTHLRQAEHGLAQVLCRTLAVQLLLPVFPRLLYVGFKFCQPLFIQRLLYYLSTDEVETFPEAAYGFIGASILIYTGIAITKSLSDYLHHRSLQMIRGCLVSAIYTKVTEVPASSGQESESITLMSSDLERIRAGFLRWQDMWTSVIEVSLACWLLYLQLGISFIAPIVVMILCAIATAYIVSYAGDSQKAWLSSVQRRVGLTASIIANMKNLKISGLTKPVGEFIQGLRTEELNAGSRFRLLILLSIIIGSSPLTLSPIFTFAFAQKALDPARMFTSLTYLTLLSSPLMNLFEALPPFLAALTCLDRIQVYLAAGSRKDTRKSLNRFLGTLREKSSNQIDMSSNEITDDSAVIIDNGSFGWSSEQTILRGINARIPRLSITVICGPIASGKSTLCKAILAEIPYSNGTISLGRDIHQSRIAYCEQTPFLSNDSIKNNIIGFTPFEEKRYLEVVSVTMLDADLQEMPSGDRTYVGSNGITLSGGQRQRLALARALYLQSEFLVLDDVFSGLDARTEEQLFTRIFGPNGLIRRRKATVILATHSVRHLPSADKIIALSSGTIVEQGKFSDLMNNPSGYTYCLGITTSSDSDAKDPIGASPDSQETEPTEFGSIPSTSPQRIENIDASRQLGDRRVYTVYLKSMGHFLVCLILFWGAVNGFANNFPTVWLKFWSEDASSETPLHSSGFYLGIYATLNVSVLISLVGICSSMLIVGISKAGANLHIKALTTLLRAPLQFLTTTDQGQIVNLFSQDINLIDTELPISVLNVTWAGFTLLGQAAVLTTTSPYMAASYPFLLVTIWALQKVYLRTSRQMRLLDLETKSPLYTHFLDTITGIVTIRAAGFINEHRAKNTALLDTSQRPAYLLQMIQDWLDLVLGLMVTGLATVLTTVAVKTHSNSGFTGASLVTLMTFGSSLTMIVVYLTQLETSLGAIARLMRFSQDVKPEEQPEENIIPPENWPQYGNIELRGISASYEVEVGRDATSDRKNLALKDLYLAIPSGEKLAVCGRTGSGKSSLIAFLLKLLEPTPETAACASIDDLALRKIDRSTLRCRIISIPQDAVFLPDGSSYRENLDPFNVTGTTDCQHVLEIVGLWNFIQDRGGLEADMSPGTFSHGQRQLFSLARAIIRRRIRLRICDARGMAEGGILLLDEMSSSVDRETEREMQAIIMVEFKHYTVIAVSHHLDMVLDFDKVVVMDKGSIVEGGEPKMLSQDSSTRFGELWRAGAK
ncbi:hypothetical protein AB5N19_12175 [Seiridium cardinale]